LHRAHSRQLPATQQSLEHAALPWLSGKSNSSTDNEDICRPVLARPEAGVAITCCR
jgi:hypothetical protein